MKVLLASPHGFCAGVVMAVRSLERALELLGSPLYVYHEIVHNRHVVAEFEQRGAIFVDDVDAVPPQANLMFSAHGVSPAVREQARQRKLFTIDATCPLVAKVHSEAIRFARLGYTIILIGHAGHDEVIGTLGEAPQCFRLVGTPEEAEAVQVKDPSHVAYLTQTTLSVDDANRIVEVLTRRFPAIVGPSKDDICYATQNRQEAVRMLAPEADLVLVVGSKNSSNSIRLTEVARERGVRAFLVDDASELEPEWFEAVDTVVVTAGASAPEHLVDECLGWLEKHYGASIEGRTVRTEDVQFALPDALRKLTAT